MLTNNPSKNLFFAKTKDGYIIKSLIEVLQNMLTDVCFSIDEKGIHLFTTDNKTRLAINLNLDSIGFDGGYYCPAPLTVGINLCDMNKIIKSIKKRDSIILYIEKNNPSELCIISIQADTKQESLGKIKNQKSTPPTLNSLKYNYRHPNHIPTNAYQKMCKDMQNISETLTLKIKGTRIVFVCKIEGILTRETPFGEESKNDEDEVEYNEQFYTKSFSQIIKVTGLNPKHMQIYAPQKKGDEIPLKIVIKTGDLGTLEIYLKTINQIKFSEENKK